jgi:hypothetical protein
MTKSKKSSKPQTTDEAKMSTENQQENAGVDTPVTDEVTTPSTAADQGGEAPVVNEDAGTQENSSTDEETPPPAEDIPVEAAPETPVVQEPEAPVVETPVVTQVSNEGVNNAGLETPVVIPKEKQAKELEAVDETIKNWLKVMKITVRNPDQKMVEAQISLYKMIVSIFALEAVLFYKAMDKVIAFLRDNVDYVPEDGEPVPPVKRGQKPRRIPGATDHRNLFRVFDLLAGNGLSAGQVSNFENTLFLLSEYAKMAPDLRAQGMLSQQIDLNKALAGWRNKEEIYQKLQAYFTEIR